MIRRMMANGWRVTFSNYVVVRSRSSVIFYIDISLSPDYTGKSFGADALIFKTKVRAIIYLLQIETV